MKKFMNWIKKNKGLTITIILAFILLIILTIILIGVLKKEHSDKYGNRLDGIEDVQISKETFEEVKKELMDSELVEDASVRIQGKIVYTTIVLKEDTSKDKAKELASGTLDNYEEEELKFYDYSFFLKWNEEEKITVITGNKHSDLDTITWINS